MSKAAKAASFIWQGIPVQWNKSARRKTIGLQVRDGCIKLLSPPRLSAAHAKTVLDNKADWLHTHWQALQQQPRLSWAHGETLPWQGGTIRLNVTQGQNRAAVLEGNCLSVQLSKNLMQTAYIQKAAQRFYKAQAELLLPQRVRLYAQAMALKPNSIRVKSYKARWGSCDARGNLSFNWRLIAAPMHVIDYVVVHELAHLVHMNHSPDFWRLVEQYYPSYRADNRWLKGQQLLIQL